jgi:hypothetical protein
VPQGIREGRSGEKRIINFLYLQNFVTPIIKNK